MRNIHRNQPNDNMPFEELFYLFFATYMMMVAAWLTYIGKDVQPFATMYVTYIGLITVFSKVPNRKGK
jgi:hypothetical protein